MVFVTGDCHGNFRRFQSDYFPEQANMAKDDTVIITGWQADCCCRHTAADAFFRGYDIVVPRETTDTDTLENYKAGLAYLKKNYGADICDLDDLLARL